MVVQLYLKMDRADLATKIWKSMVAADEDSTLTSLASAWVNIASDKAQEASSRPVVAPLPPTSLATSPPRVDTSDIILPPAPPVPVPLPNVAPTVAPPPPPPSPTPSFDPVAARPSNSPGGWVTQADYRQAWISREYTGTVGFRLSVGASGRVENCSVTRSSGVSALDQATCQLITRRARFDPAKNGQGRAVAGTYSSAVRWQLPD